MRSVLEMREEVRWYLSFTDKEIFKGVPLPEEEESPQTPGTTGFPEAPCMPEPVPESLQDGKKCYTYPGWWWPLEISLGLPGSQDQRWKQNRYLRWYP